MYNHIYVYAEQDTSPRFFEVLKAIKDAHGVTATMLPYNFVRGDEPVLVFGKVTDPAFMHHNVIYTYSPAQVLTKANASTVVGSALLRASGKLPEVPQEPTYSTWYGSEAHSNLYNSSLMNRVYDQAKDNKHMVVDIETSGDLNTDGPERVQILSVAFYIPSINESVVIRGSYYDSVGDDYFVEQLADLLRLLIEAGVKFIWHNGKFDTRVLNRVLGMTVPVDHDTMLMHHVLFQAAGLHALKALCKLYLGADEWEGDLKKWTVKGAHYENIPYDILAKYNGLDVYWTYKLYLYLEALLEAEPDKQRAYLLELEASAFLLKVEQRGIPVDVEAIRNLKDSTAVNMELHQRLMSDITGNEKFNPNSPKQIKEWLASAGKTVDKTDVHTITIIRDLTTDPQIKRFCANLLAYRKAAKVHSTYAKGWENAIGPDGRVHPTFKVHGTSTGRLSSSQPNAQNMPRDSRVRAMIGL